MRDAPARSLARTFLGKNMVVEAGAGTGKTSLLTDRILTLLLAGGREGQGIDISRLAAVTFTEKAAGEIKARLAQRLADLLAHVEGRPLPAERGRWIEDWRRAVERPFGRSTEDVLSMARNALAGLDRAPIGTIHHFARAVLNAFPKEAALDPRFEVDPGPRFEELFGEEWTAWIAEELKGTSPRADRWRRVLPHAALADVRTLARALAGAAGRDESSTPAAVEKIRRLRESVEAVSAGKPDPGGSSEILDSLSSVAAHLQSLEASMAVADAPWPAPPAEDSSVNKNRKWPKAWAGLPGEDAFTAGLKTSRRASDFSHRLLSETRRLLEPFGERFRRRRREEGFLGFDDLIRAARDLVRDNLLPRESLKEKYEAILLDEFQDTDPVQGEMFLLLAEKRGGNARRWSDIELEPGKLFVVGDPKQSIYRFRGADIRAYQAFIDKILSQGGERCDLQTSFRSPEGLVEPVNAVFSALIRETPELQPAYRPLFPRPGGGPADPAVDLVVSRARAGASAEDFQRAEALWIARWIDGHARRGNGRGWRYRDIAILFRTTSAVSVFVEALRELNIPHVIDSGRSFFRAQEVVDFLNFLRLLSDPGDTEALFAVLRSPLVLLTDEELLALARAGVKDFRLPWPPGLSAKLRERLAPHFGLWMELHAEAGRRPLGEFVARVLERTLFLPLAAGAYQGEQTAANILKVARRAREEEAVESMTLARFAAGGGEENETSVREGESSLAEENRDVVRLLTIHKAKGLEFPVVFLPNLAASKGALVDRAPRRADWGSGLVGLRLPGAGWADGPMALLALEEAKRESHEGIRLFYVGATRPRERLILMAREGADEPSSFQALLERAGFDAGAEGPWALTDGKKIPITFLDVAPAPTGGRAAASPARPAPRPTAAWRRLWKQRRSAWESLSAERVFDAPSARVKTGGKTVSGPGGGPGVGRLCHWVLERWDFRAEGALPALAEKAARTLGEPADVEKEALGVLQSFAGSEAAKRLAGAEILGREVPFLFEEEGRAVRGSFDVLYRADGRLGVIDYKTDRLSGDLSAAAAAYEPQGRCYVKALERCLGWTAGFDVLFLRPGVLVPVIK